MAKRTFNAISDNPYTDKQAPEQQPDQTTAKPKKTHEDDYRFSLRVSAECGEYLREMAWRNRITITEFITRIIEADMNAHPEWKDTIDVLNTPRK